MPTRMRNSKKLSRAGRATPTRWSITECSPTGSGMTKRRWTTGSARSTSTLDRPTHSFISRKCSINKVQLQAAARHYRMYLEIVAARHAKNPADTGPLLAALIKVADADAAINHTSDASKGYVAAAGFAEKAGEKTLESLALVHLADLQEKARRHSRSGAVLPARAAA